MPAARPDKGAGVMVLPRRLVGTQIAFQGILPPGHLGRRDDRREGGQRGVAVRVANRDSERAMAAHRVAHDPRRTFRDRKFAGDKRRQFVGDVVVHPVVSRPGFFGGVDVETGAQAEIIGAVGVVRHVVAARAGVGCDDDQPELRRDALETRLRRRVFPCAGQPREVPDHGAGARPGLRRQKDGKLHPGAGGLASVCIDTLEAFETAPARYRLHVLPPVHPCAGPHRAATAVPAQAPRTGMADPGPDATGCRGTTDRRSRPRHGPRRSPHRRCRSPRPREHSSAGRRTVRCPCARRRWRPARPLPR